MTRFSNLWRNLTQRDRMERDLDDEVRGSFELLVDEKIKAGGTPEEARRAARLELGGVDVHDARRSDAQGELAVQPGQRAFGRLGRRGRPRAQNQRGHVLDRSARADHSRPDDGNHLMDDGARGEKDSETPPVSMNAVPVPSALPTVRPVPPKSAIADVRK